MLSRIRAILKKRGHKVFSRPFELNIVGLRSKHTTPNAFDDEVHVFYKGSDKAWAYHIFPATTDPGTFWLNNPSSLKGTAILKEGQYENAYAIGKHQGKYLALVQVRPVTVIRDYDRDSRLDFKSPKEERGMFGINIHHAAGSGKTRQVDKYSAGCQVLEDAAGFEKLLALSKRHVSLYGNHITYTLIDFRAMRKETFKRMAKLAIALPFAIQGAIYAYDYFNGEK